MTKSIIMNGEAKTIFNEFLWESGLDNSVRLATMQDVESIVHIEQKCFDVTKYDSLLDAPSVQKLLGKSNGVLIVYEQEHPTRPKIAGYAQVYFRKKSPTARFFSLAVLPEWQGQGIANLLFKSVEIMCKASGVNTLQLEIRSDNHVLLYRYKKMGYQQYTMVPDYYPDRCSAIKMRRTL